MTPSAIEVVNKLMMSVLLAILGVLLVFSFGPEKYLVPFLKHKPQQEIKRSAVCVDMTELLKQTHNGR